MNHQLSYETNMKEIGYLCSTIHNHYDSMKPEVFERISRKIAGLLQESYELLSSNKSGLELEIKNVSKTEKSEPMDMERFYRFDRNMNIIGYLYRTLNNGYNKILPDDYYKNAVRLICLLQESGDVLFQ